MKPKSYTDLNQSKKLAEILPLDSADMLFQLGEDKYADSIRVPLTNEHWEQMMPTINPCWSLAALLDQLPDGFIDKEGNIYCLDMFKEEGKYQLIYEAPAKGFVIETEMCDNSVDACVEMIIKLHELNLL